MGFRLPQAAFTRLQSDGMNSRPGNQHVAWEGVVSGPKRRNHFGVVVVVVMAMVMLMIRVIKRVEGGV